MSSVNKQLENGYEVIDYQKVIDVFPWIIKPGQNIILGPDSDGFLCGLIATHFLDCNVVGYYDGKVLIIKDGISVDDCVFLDVEINRPNIRSLGNHLVTYNNRLSHKHYSYDNCIQPNIFRNFDGKKDFQRKYPFGAVHLYLGILHHANIITSLPSNSIWPLLFADGVWNNLFGYTENCLDWIKYLQINKSSHILNPHFCSSGHSFYEIMEGLNSFLRMRDEFNARGYYNGNEYQEGGRNKRSGHQLKLSNPKGIPINLVKNNDQYDIHTNEKERIAGFISSMSTYIEIPYNPQKWTWGGFRVETFSKGDFSTTSLNNGSYNNMMDKKPLSMAMTSGANIEYTIENPGRFN